MYTNILIPTDGSELAQKAVEQGVRLAKGLGAKVTALTVSEPFHVFSVAPSQLEYTRDEYKRHTDAVAAKALGGVSAARPSMSSTSMSFARLSTPPKRGAAI